MGLTVVLVIVVLVIVVSTTIVVSAAVMMSSSSVLHTTPEGRCDIRSPIALVHVVSAMQVCATRVIAVIPETCVAG